MFNFDVRYVLDKRHITTDELFWKSREFSNDIDKVHEKNIDNFIDDQFNCVRIYLMWVNENNDKQFLKNEYSEKFQKIIYYLITLARFNYLNRKKFRKFKNWVLQFLVHDRDLFKWVKKMFCYEKSLTRQKIKQSYWSNFMTKVNIANEKKFIDVCRTDINDEIIIEIVKCTSLIVNHVSCVLSIEKKKRFISFEFRICFRK